MEIRVKTFFTTIRATVLVLGGLLSFVPFAGADELDKNCAKKISGFPGALCQALIELRAQVKALESVITVDGAGNATIQPTGNLTLDSGGMTNLMDDTMVEGNSMMMKDATVMGATILEGDSLMMQDAMVMGNALLESETNVAGTFVQPFAKARVDVNGILVLDEASLSSSLAITQRDSDLIAIPAAALEGTRITIKYLPEVGQGRIRVLNCLFLGGCSEDANVALKSDRGVFKMNPGDFLVLNWNGTLWEEVARSSGQGAVAVLVTDPLFLGAGGMRMERVACDPEAIGDSRVPGGGIPNSSLLVGSVQVLSGTINVVKTEILNLNGGGGGAGINREAVEVFSATVENTGGTQGEFTLKARCLVL